MEKKPIKPEGLAAFARTLPESRSRFDEPRRLLGDELKEHLAEVLDRVPGDLSGHRLAVAWRIARAIGAAQGHLAHDEFLSAIPENAWHEWRASYSQGQPAGAPPWRKAVSEAHLPIIPREDTDAHREVVWLVAAGLGIRKTRDGRLGLLALLDWPEGEPSPWPEPWQLVALERALVLHVHEVATQTTAPETKDAEAASMVKATRLLREDFGLSQPEVESVLALAHRHAHDAMPAGQDSMRALQYHALEDLARRAALALDLRSEIAARRLLAQVSGVTRTEPENAEQDFINVVRRVVQIQDRQPLPALPPAIRAIPQDLPEGLSLEEVVGDSADEEALDEYDRENPTD